MTLPQDFIQQMQALLGTEQSESFFDALNGEAPTSIRLNPSKPTQHLDGQPVAWCPEGRYLSSRPSFTLDPIFHAGTYYVQEASSMYLWHVVRQCVGEQPVLALDLCAAPGGKSTLLHSALPTASFIVSNEIVRHRADILRENIIKWGSPHNMVTNNAAADFQALGTVFDLILCDVPCSGEGMFRKDPDAITEWSLQNVDMCQQRQRDILTDIWPCLRPGGLLIYSTCTYNTKENEENVRWIINELGAEAIDSHPDPSWNITGSLLPGFDAPVCRFLPHKTRGEGLFMAVLRKTDTTTLPRPKPKKAQKTGNLRIPALLDSWMQPNDGTITTTDGQSFTHVTPSSLPPCQALTTLNRGTDIATAKGKDRLQPAHSLAMSSLLNPAAFPSAEISELEALAYLRTEALTLPPDTPRGYVLLTYQQHPLGFVNNLGSRANNLYPSAWRIRMKA